MAFESRLELTVDSRSGEKRLKDFEQRLDRVDKAGERVSQGMGMLKTAIGGALAAAGGFSVSRVISETAKFQDSMLGLQAVSGATEKQMKSLEKQARTLGATSAFSAQQAGQAQRFLAQAGFEVNEALSATPGILNLATAGQMNLAQAADIASNVLGGMRLEVDQLNRVNDVLAATAAGSNTNISQLGQALSTAAPLAASAGVSIEETAAAIGTLSDAGIQAERAGTGLQGIFRQLSNVTPQAKEALASYGVSLQDVNIEANGLGPVLETLRDANISTSDAFRIFGSEAGAAAQILLHSAGRVGEFTGELESSEGAAREAALIIGSGLSGSMRAFNSALSESILQLGDSGLSGGFQSVTDTASGLLSVYNGMLPEFAEANDLTEDQADNLETMAGALSAATGAAGALSGAYITVTGATWGFHTAQRALNAAVRANPYVATASALIALSGALYGARNATIELGNTQGEVGQWVEATWVELGDTISGSFSGAMGAVDEALMRTDSQAWDVAQSMWVTFEELMKSIVNVSRGSVNAVITYAMTMGDTFQIVARTIRESFANSFQNALALASGFWKDLQAIFNGDLSFSNFKAALRDAVVEPLSGAADEIQAAYQENAQDHLGNISEGLFGAFEDFGERVSRRVEVMNMEFQTLNQHMRDLGDTSGDIPLQTLGEWFLKTPPAARDAADGIKEFGDSSDDASESSSELAKELERQASELDSLRKRLDPAYAASQRLAESTAILDRGLASGALTLNEYLNLWDKAAETFIEARNSSDDATDDINDNTDEMATLWERRLERMDDAAVDMWRSFLDGSEGAFDSFKNLALDTLAEVIHAYTTRQITTTIGAQIGIGGQGASTAGSGGGFGNIASIGKQVYSGVVDGFSSVAWTGASNTAYAGGWAGSATSGVGQSGFLGGSTSNFGGSTGLMSLGASMIGSEVGDAVSGALTDKQANSSWGQMAGTAIGTYFGGPIGAGLGSALGSVVDSLFGSGGSDLDISMQRRASSQGHAWDHGIVAEGGLGAVGFNAGGSHEVADLWDIDEAQQLVDSIAQLDTAVASLAETPDQLAAMRDAVLASNRHGIQGHYGETSHPDEVVDRLTSRYNDAFGALDEEFAEFMLGLDGSIDEVVQRGVTARQAFTALSDAADRLDLRFDDTTASAYEAASSLAEMAGGTQQLTSLQQNYYQTLYSEEERLNQLRSDVIQQLNAMGMSLPRSRDGFRDLVEAQDLNTEAGQRNYTQLLQLVDSFDRLADSGALVNAEVAKLDDQIAGLKDDVKSAYEAFQNQAFDQRVQLLELAGKGEAALALQREKELESIDPLLHETQRHIWAMQDEAEAKEQATRAANDYAAQLGEIGSALSGVGDWLDQRRATQQSPMDNRRAAEESFKRQLALAESGDRDALQSITQYADRFLSAEESMHASGAQYQRTEQRVYKALEGLPDAISDAEYIVDGFRDVVTGELAGAIKTAILDSQYTIDTLIDFAANTDQLPDDLRTILGEQAHRLDSVLNYLVGKNDLDAELRQLALTSSNRLVSTIDLVAGTDELSRADRRLALQGSNLFTSTIDLALGEDLTAQNRRLALQSSNAYSSVVDLVLGADLSADSRTLALESSHAYAAAINFAVGSDISSESRRLALSSGSTYRTLMQYAVDQDISQQDRRLALRAGNRYASRIDMILRRDELTADDRRLALGRANQYASTIDLILGADISDQERQLALGTSNRLTSTIDAALGNVGPQERTLAFHSANAIQTTISGVLANNIPDNVRQLALQNANQMTTTVKGVLRDTPPNVRKFALERSNSLTATVSGVLASNVDDDVKTLALKHANSFTTTLRAALDDNSISNDERKLLDARSEQIVKTLRTDGGLDLTDEEWAVISAASGSKRMELLADVAFNQSDLNELDGIQDNTKSMEERARDQLERLNALVSEMANTTDQFVDMNSTMVSLRDSINALGVAQEEQNRIERERRERERREQERLQRERERQQKINQKEGRIGEIASQMSDAEYGIGRASGGLSNDQQRNIHNMIANFAGGDNLMTGQERQNFIENRASNWSGERRAYGIRVAQQFTRASQIERLERQIANLQGVDRDNAWNAGSEMRGLDPTRGMSRDEAYLYRYPDVAANWDGSPYEHYMKEGRYEGRHYAQGGVFTNSIVSEPTRFSESLMGEAGPEAIMPLTRHADGGLGIRAELPPIPAVPLLGQSDIVETLNDLRREVAGLRAENARLLGESNEHLGAANRQRGEGMKRQLEEQRRGNGSLDRISSEAQLEAAR